MNDGVRKLIASALAQASETILDIAIDQFDDQPGASDAEKLIFSALMLVAKIGQHEHTNVAFVKAGSVPPNDIELSTCIYVAPQSGSERLHFDFAVYAYDHRARYLPSPGWRRLIVECDDVGGPSDDREFPPISRDQSAETTLQIAKVQLLQNPWGAAEHIFDWAAWSFG